MKAREHPSLSFVCKECGFKPEGSAPEGPMQWRQYPRSCEKCGGDIIPKIVDTIDEARPE